MQSEIQALHAIKHGHWFLKQWTWTWWVVNGSSKLKRRPMGLLKGTKPVLLHAASVNFMVWTTMKHSMPLSNPTPLDSFSQWHSLDWPLKQLDVSNAFLHGDLQEKLFLTQPPGFEDLLHPDYVCRLHKALYGLKQAPWAWYMNFSSYIQHMGFQRRPYDTSLFSRRQGPDVILLLIYVDGIIKVGSSVSSINKFCLICPKFFTWRI